MSATLDLAGAVVALMDGLTGKSLPEPLLDGARNVLLDHLSAPNGHQDDPVVIAAVELGDSLGNPTTTIRAAGSDRVHDVFAAAFVTAAAAGAGVSGSGDSGWAGRFAAPALGAALALGQLRPVSGKRWLTAFALGCETHLQFARALGRDLVKRGWDRPLNAALAVVPHQQQLIAAAHAAGVRVVYVNHTTLPGYANISGAWLDARSRATYSVEDLCLEGSWGAR